MLKINRGAFELALKTLVDAYNSAVEPNERLSLIREVNAKMVETKTLETFDTKDLFVCLYDENRVGIFQRKRLKDTCDGYFDTYTNLFFEQASVRRTVYEGISLKSVWLFKDRLVCGTVVTCNMIKAVSYDEFRFDLLREGKIDPYELGTTTKQEMLNLLKYAPEYFGLSQEPDKIKEKI